MIKRNLESIIKNLSKHFPVILLTGPRQVGKTTLLENISEDREYVTLDDFNQRQLAKTDPALFLQIHKPPLFIDEVQYAPELFSYIKMYVDKNKNSGDFWLSGSQKFHLMKNITETLAGRVAVLDMLGLSYSEINDKENIPFLPTQQWINSKLENQPAALDIISLYEKIFRGSYPKLIADKEMPRDIFYSSYVQTYIDRDVKDITKIGNEIKFATFLKVIAARTGQLINYQDIASSVEIDLKTAQSWTSILEASGIIKLLYPYHNNLTKRAIKTPKMYFLDTGLCSYLTGWDSPVTLMNGAMSGNILETYVFSEILKSYWNVAKNPNIYFYRDGDQREIDFLFEINETLYPVEVKKSANPDKKQVSAFKVLNNLGKQVGEGAVLCLYNSILPITENINAVPIWYI